MTVEELINALQQYDPKLRVAVQGYEGGYSDVSRAEPVELALNVHDDWYYGPHYVSDAFHVKPKHTRENAILIL